MRQIHTRALAACEGQAANARNADMLNLLAMFMVMIGINEAWAMGPAPLGGNDRVHLTVTGPVQSQSEYLETVNGGQLHVSLGGNGTETLYKQGNQTASQSGAAFLHFFVTGMNEAAVPPQTQNLLRDLHDCLGMAEALASTASANLTLEADVQMLPGGDNIQFGGFGGPAVLLMIPANSNLISSVACFEHPSF